MPILKHADSNDSGKLNELVGSLGGPAGKFALNLLDSFGLAGGIYIDKPDGTSVKVHPGALLADNMSFIGANVADLGSAWTTESMLSGPKNKMEEIKRRIAKAVEARLYKEGLQHSEENSKNALTFGRIVAEGLAYATGMGPALAVAETKLKQMGVMHPKMMGYREGTTKYNSALQRYNNISSLVSDVTSRQYTDPEFRYYGLDPATTISSTMNMLQNGSFNDVLSRPDFQQNGVINPRYTKTVSQRIGGVNHAIYEARAMFGDAPPDQLYDTINNMFGKDAFKTYGPAVVANAFERFRLSAEHAGMSPEQIPEKLNEIVTGFSKAGMDPMAALNAAPVAFGAMSSVRTGRFAGTDIPDINTSIMAMMVNTEKNFSKGNYMIPMLSAAYAKMRSMGMDSKDIKFAIDDLSKYKPESQKDLAGRIEHYLPDKSFTKESLQTFGNTDDAKRFMAFNPQLYASAAQNMARNYTKSMSEKLSQTFNLTDDQKYRIQVQGADPFAVITSTDPYGYMQSPEAQAKLKQQIKQMQDTTAQEYGMPEHKHAQAVFGTVLDSRMNDYLNTIRVRQHYNKQFRNNPKTAPEAFGLSSFARNLYLKPETIENEDFLSTAANKLGLGKVHVKMTPRAWEESGASLSTAATKQEDIRKKKAQEAEAAKLNAGQTPEVPKV